MNSIHNDINKNESVLGRVFQVLLAVLLLLFAFFQGWLVKSRWINSIEFPENFIFIAPGLLLFSFLVILKIPDLFKTSLKHDLQSVSSEDGTSQNQDVLNHLLESIHDVVWSFDLTGNQQNYVSRSAEAMYGKPVAELKSRPYFWLDIHPEDSGIKDDVVEQLRKKGDVEFTCRIVGGNKLIRWISTKVRIVHNDQGDGIRLEGSSREITYIKQTEMIIERQEFQLRALFENLDMAFTIVDKTGTVLMFNKLTEELCKGISRPLKEGLNMFDLAPAEKRPMIQNLFEQAVRTKKTTSYVTNYADEKNVQQYFSIYYIPVFDSENEVQQICIMSRNITAQKIADEKLNNERKLLRTLIDNIPDFVYVKDKSLKHIINNQANVSLIGASSEAETLGKTVMDYFPEPVATLFLNADRKILETGIPVINTEEEILDQEGEKHWLLTTKIPVKDESGEIAYLVGISRDITERKRMELDLRFGNERFSMACHATGDAIWDWDLINDQVYLGDNFTELFGHDWGNTSAGSDKRFRYVHPDDMDRVKNSLQAFFEFSTSEKKWQSSYRYICANGAIAYVLDRGYLIYDDAGKPVRMIGAIQNVTEITEYRRSLEQKVRERTLELNKALLKEKELVEVKTRFVSIASHEFRTPLSTIQFAAGFLKQFHEKLNAEQMISKLEGIEKQVNHMTILLDDILTIGKAESGKMNVIVSKVNLKDFFENISAEIHSTCVTHTIQRRYQAGTLEILAEEKFLRNIFVNLLSNAIKFSPGKTSVYVDLSVEDSKVHVCIKDEGVGISKNEIDAIFDPFHRGDNVKDIPGTGLGLSIVKRAVELLDGEIFVRSTEGEGSAFTITFPQLL